MSRAIAYALNSFAKRQKKLQCKYISTGHYARTYFDSQKNTLEIYSSNDKEHDQSYFLGRVDPEYLKHLILPLSNLEKKEVIALAKQHKLNYLKRCEKSESCFFKQPQILDIIEKNSHESLRPSASIVGPGSSSPTSDEIGSGIYKFYRGQKISIPSDSPANMIANPIVTDLHAGRNEITLGTKDDLSKRKMQIGQLQFRESFDCGLPCQVYIKFEDGITHIATIFFKNNNFALVEFEKSIYNKGKGHVAIFYDHSAKGAKVLASGVVEQFEDFTPIKRINNPLEKKSGNPDESEDKNTHDNEFHF